MMLSYLNLGLLSPKLKAIRANSQVGFFKFKAEEGLATGAFSILINIYKNCYWLKRNYFKI